MIRVAVSLKQEFAKAARAEDYSAPELAAVRQIADSRHTTLVPMYPDSKPGLSHIFLTKAENEQVAEEMVEAFKKCEAVQYACFVRPQPPHAPH